MGEYWGARRRYRYLAEARRLARVHAVRVDSVIDVGSKDCRYVLEYDWIADKTTLDLRPRPALPGVASVTADFMTWRPPRIYGLVLCLQVLEHVPTPAAFLRKLFATGLVVVVSVPYRWPAGADRSHRHDPITPRRLERWAARRWEEVSIVEDRGRARMICVFPGALPGWARSPG